MYMIPIVIVPIKTWIYTFQLLFNCIGFCVLCYAFLSAASHIYSKQAQIQVGVTN